jgi:DNA-binding transcriptional MocR family regulator
MTQQADLRTPVDAASVWDGLDPRTLLSEAAQNIGVGTSTDQGWAPQVASLIPPIGMTGGIPDATRLPVEDLMAAIRVAVEESAADALRYGGTLGFEGLRTALAERSQAMDGLAQTADNFIITNGSSAAIDLVYRTFLQPGDVVVAESPSFSGSLRTIRGNLGHIVPVAMDGEGLDVDDLERVLTRLDAEGTPAKLLYTVPDYHNPTGTNLSLERRRALIEVAARHRMLILEDDATLIFILTSSRCPASTRSPAAAVSCAPARSARRSPPACAPAGCRRAPTTYSSAIRCASTWAGARSSTAPWRATSPRDSGKSIRPRCASSTPPSVTPSARR